MLVVRDLCPHLQGWLSQTLVPRRWDPWGWSGIAICSLALVVYRRRRLPTSPLSKRTAERVPRLKDSAESETLDPPLLKQHSTFQSYTTTYATYPSIRVFYHPHAQVERIPEPNRDLPLLVVCHGLGGSLAQFAPILGSLVNLAPCLGIDLPGNGRSTFAPTSWNAYTVDALATLVAAAIQKYGAEHGHNQVILIGHSMGCSHAALLASKNSSLSCPLQEVAGLIAICPKLSIPNRKETRYLRVFLSLPDVLLDVMRWFDRRGGVNSRSVNRFVGEEASLGLRQLQLRYNSSFPTRVWKRIAYGCLPFFNAAGGRIGGLPGPLVWAGLDIPLLLVAGQSDAVTKPAEVASIVAALRNASTSDTVGAIPAPSSPLHDHKGSPVPESDASGAVSSTRELKSQHLGIVKTAVLPSPASHALLYDPSTYRTLAGLIQDFLARYVSRDLDLGFQLQQLATSGKWDVKNLKKWQRTVPVSEPIAGGIFRAMKTLREQDEHHTPAVFAEEWQGKISAVIDISHDTPVYDSRALERAGIQYHKFATVSKVPPTVEEVRDFISLVDRIRGELAIPDEEASTSRDRPSIAIHCHYGFNRTGFFVASYLIEKEGYRVQDAIGEFASKRPPGIRHEHFVDTVYLRYCKGLQ